MKGKLQGRHCALIGGKKWKGVLSIRCEVVRLGGHRHKQGGDYQSKKGEEAERKSTL